MKPRNRLRLPRIAGVVAFLVFGPPVAAGTLPESTTVEGAVEEGVAKNLDLLAEKFSVPIARAALVAAKLRPNPEFSAGADHLDLLGTHYDEENAAGPPEYSARFDYTVETGKKRRRRIELARKEISIAQLQLTRAIQLLMLEIQEAAVDVQQARLMLEVARENQTAFKKVVDLNRERARAGDIAQVELTRSEVVGIHYENALVETQRDHRIAREKLQRLLGRPAEAPLIDVEGQPKREKQLVPVEDLETMAMDLRPDLAALRKDRERAHADLALQKANARQNFTVGTEYRRQNGLAGRGNSLGFFVTTPLPVYDRNQGEIERARQETDRAVVLVQAKEAEIRQEARVAHQQGETALKLVTQLETGMVEKSQQVLDTMVYSYQRGEATFLDVLEARRALSETMTTYNEARADLARSLYRIDLISGRSLPP